MSSSAFATSSSFEGPWGRYAAVDIGSHTVRLLVAEWHADGKLYPLHNERHVTRLAQGFLENGLLTDRAMERTAAVLSDIAVHLQNFSPRAVRCGATGVVRKASNGFDFIRRVQAMAPWKVSILTEAEEAALSLQGMLSVLQPENDLVVCFDLGGSSTELALVDRHSPWPLWIGSVFLGAATLTETYFQEAPVSMEQVHQAARHARRVLQPAVESIFETLQKASLSGKKWTVAGTAGTVTTLAAMEARMDTYVPYRINNRTLTKAWIAETVRFLASLSLEARRGLVGLEPGREDIILGGVVIVKEILDCFGAFHMLVSDAGLLEGLLLDLLQGAATQSGVSPQWVWRLD
ncbi:MAG: hypothetical protein WHS46_08985 [Desulfosoma sp.]